MVFRKCLYSMMIWKLTRNYLFSIFSTFVSSELSIVLLNDIKYDLHPLSMPDFTLSYNPCNINGATN